MKQADKPTNTPISENNLPLASLPDEFFRFVCDNARSDTVVLRLKYAGKDLPFPLDFALTQIEARRASAFKLRHLLENERFLFPHRLSAEQATAEEVAALHPNVGLHPDAAASEPSPDAAAPTWLDMTAGLGVDAMAAARVGFSVTACELNPAAAEALGYNSRLHGFENIRVINADSVKWLANQNDRWDVIFIDPARRDASAARTYAFADCEPDVVQLMPLLLSKSRRVMVKASPMLDIKQVFRELPMASEVVVTALRGDCKEVLVRVGVAVRNDGENNSRNISCINILSNGSLTEFNCLEEELGKQPETFATADEIESAKFLFEPDASVMKTGAWRRLTADFPFLKKVSKDTHLFVSQHIDEGESSLLPGRLLTIEQRLGSKDLKRLKGERLNIVCRNYGAKPEDLRRRLHIFDGTDRFLYAFRDSDNKSRLLTCIRQTNS